MVTIHKNKLVIEIKSENPKKTLKQLKRSIALLTSEFVMSDDFYNSVESPESVAILITYITSKSKDTRFKEYKSYHGFKF